MARVQYYLRIRISTVKITGNSSPLQSLDSCLNPKVSKASLIPGSQLLTFTSSLCWLPQSPKNGNTALSGLLNHFMDQGLPRLHLNHIQTHPDSPRHLLGFFNGILTHLSLREQIKKLPWFLWAFYLPFLFFFVSFYPTDRG